MDDGDTLMLVGIIKRTETCQYHQHPLVDKNFLERLFGVENHMDPRPYIGGSDTRRFVYILRCVTSLGGWPRAPHCSGASLPMTSHRTTVPPYHSTALATRC